MRLATRVAALMVTRRGAADAIPPAPRWKPSARRISRFARGRRSGHVAAQAHRPGDGCTGRPPPGRRFRRVRCAYGSSRQAASIRAPASSPRTASVGSTGRRTAPSVRRSRTVGRSETGQAAGAAPSGKGVPPLPTVRIRHPCREPAAALIHALRIARTSGPGVGWPRSDAPRPPGGRAGPPHPRRHEGCVGLRRGRRCWSPWCRSR